MGAQGHCGVLVSPHHIVSTSPCPDTVLSLFSHCAASTQETGDKWPEDADFWQDDTFLKNKDTSDTIPQPDDILQATTSLWHDDTDGDTPLRPEDVAWVEAPSPHPLSPMPAPLCLVDNSDGNKLSVNPEALAVLRGITQPVVVVAIAGPYRTGKSFLMNRLAKQRTGELMGGNHIHFGHVLGHFWDC